MPKANREEMVYLCLQFGRVRVYSRGQHGSWQQRWSLELGAESSSLKLQHWN